MLRKLWCALQGHEDDQVVTLDTSLTLRVCTLCRRESWSGPGNEEERARARRILFATALVRYCHEGHAILAEGKLPIARTVVPR